VRIVTVAARLDSTPDVEIFSALFERCGDQVVVLRAEGRCLSGTAVRRMWRQGHCGVATAVPLARGTTGGDLLTEMAGRGTRTQSMSTEDQSDAPVPQSLRRAPMIASAVRLCSARRRLTSVRDRSSGSSPVTAS
jgi:hypothetical protein